MLHGTGGVNVLTIFINIVEMLVSTSIIKGLPPIWEVGRFFCGLTFGK